MTNMNWVSVIGRLQPGVTPAQAGASLTRVAVAHEFFTQGRRRLPSLLARPVYSSEGSAVEVLARLYWPGQDAIGRRLLLKGRGAFEIVGVVQDFTLTSVDGPVPPVVFMDRIRAFGPTIDSRQMLVVALSVVALAAAYLPARRAAAVDPAIALRAD